MRGSSIMTIALLVGVIAFDSMLRRASSYHTMRLSNYDTKCSSFSCLKSTTDQILFEQQSSILLYSLLDPVQRPAALEGVTLYSDEEILSLSPGLLKTVVAAAVEGGNENSLLSIISRLYTAGAFNNELMCSSIYIACKRRKALLAYAILNSTLNMKSSSSSSSSSSFSISSSISGHLTYDTELITAVVDNLIKSSHLQEAYQLLTNVSKHAFGSSINCDIATYKALMEAAGRCDDHELLISSAKLLADFQKAVGNNDEEEFIDALTLFSLSGDAVAATKLFSLYEDYHGIVQTRSYALLLNAYLLRGLKPPGYHTATTSAAATITTPATAIPAATALTGSSSKVLIMKRFNGSNSSSNDSKFDSRSNNNNSIQSSIDNSVNRSESVSNSTDTISARNNSRNRNSKRSMISEGGMKGLDVVKSARVRHTSEEELQQCSQKMESILHFIITSNIDISQVISNLVLRYLCKQRDVAAAYWYFHRMRRLHHLPTTAALVAYSQLLAEQRDVPAVTDLHGFLVSKSLLPFREIIPFSLHRAVKPWRQTVDEYLFPLRCIVEATSTAAAASESNTVATAPLHAVSAAATAPVANKQYSLHSEFRAKLLQSSVDYTGQPPTSLFRRLCGISSQSAAANVATEEAAVATVTATAAAAVTAPSTMFHSKLRESSFSYRDEDLTADRQPFTVTAAAAEEVQLGRSQRAVFRGMVAPVVRELFSHVANATAAAVASSAMQESTMATIDTADAIFTAADAENPTENEPAVPKERLVELQKIIQVLSQLILALVGPSELELAEKLVQLAFNNYRLLPARHNLPIRRDLLRLVEALITRVFISGTCTRITEGLSPTVSLNSNSAGKETLTVDAMIAARLQREWTDALMMTKSLLKGIYRTEKEQKLFDRDCDHLCSRAASASEREDLCHFINVVGDQNSNVAPP